MKHPKKTQVEQPILYLKIFVSVVLFLIMFSLIFKFIRLVEKSQFKSDSLTVLVVNHDAYILQIKKSPYALSVLKISQFGDVAKSQSRLSNSIFLGIPLDAEIIDPGDSFSGDASSFFNFSNLTSVLLGSKNLKLVNMNELDFFNIYKSIKSVSQKDILVQKIDNYSYAYTKDRDNTENLIYQTFKNRSILNDITSVEVINATEVDGSGSRVSQMLKNTGYNILSVSSSDKSEKSKIIMRVDNPLLEKRLKSLFEIPIEKLREQHMSDVSIILGRDMSQEIERLPGLN